ncbi:MAG: PIN domain-containing protein [Zetaproteobacteria bacterium]|nr:PIN domain-containing protein [Zetaproteobacteria bacterium]
MMYMLDTNICVCLIKHNPIQVRAKFEKLQSGDVLLSSIVLAELSYGISKSQYKERNLAALEMFLMPLEVMPFDEHATGIYGEIRADLERSGQVIGGNDLLIAAHALALNATLVSNNLKEFARVPDLKLENWVD